MFVSPYCSKAHADDADLFASVNGNTQNDGGFIYKYTPAGVQSTFVSGLSRPRGVKFGCAGDLFVATTTLDMSGNFQETIFKVTPAGVVSIFATGFPTNFFLEGLAFDSAGNLFVAGEDLNDPNMATTIFKITPGGGISTFGSVPSLGFGLAFDSAGNLFAASSADPTIYKFTPGGVRSVFVGPAAFTPPQGPIDLAFDSAGNLFASAADSNGNGQILKFAPDGTETIFATGLTNNPRGLAFDSLGNLFVAEVPTTTTGDILKFPPTGGVGTVFAAGIGRPQGNGGPEFLAFPQMSQITAAGVTCKQFSSCSAVTITTAAYTVNSSGLINGVAPGKFVYWVKVTAPAGSNMFVVNQSITTGNFNTQFMLDRSGSSVVTGRCGNVSGETFTQNTTVGPSSTVTVTFNAPSAGTYFIAVRFNTTNIKNAAAPTPSTVHYNFSTAGVPASTSVLDLTRRSVAAY